MITPVILGLGSNRCHGRHGRPDGVVRAACAALTARGVVPVRLSPLLQTPPLGPSKRRYANAVLLARWAGDAAGLLRVLKQLERDFGRRPGQRWGARVLDCDLIAFGQAVLQQRNLVVPHPRLHQRDFVLKPMLAVWPGWKHPVLGLTTRHMAARLARARPVD